MTLRFLSLILLFAGQAGYSQAGDTLKPKPDVKQKMQMLRDSLKGEWRLAYKLIISKGKQDTVKYTKPGNQQSRPDILVNFKRNGALIIIESAFGKESNVTKAEWKVELRSWDQTDRFFIEIVKSDHKKMTDELHGLITGLTSQQLQITGEDRKRFSKSRRRELNFTRLSPDLDTAKLVVFNKTGSALTPEQLKTADSILIHTVDYYNSQIAHGDGPNNDPIVLSFGSADEIDLKHYCRQYTVRTFEDGLPIIDAFCFCEDMVKSSLIKWKKFPIRIHDGGSCVFAVTLDLTKRQGRMMRVNGR